MDWKMPDHDFDCPPCARAMSRQGLSSSRNPARSAWVSLTRSRNWSGPSRGVWKD